MNTTHTRVHTYTHIYIYTYIVIYQSGEEPKAGGQPDVMRASGEVRDIREKLMKSA